MQKTRICVIAFMALLMLSFSLIPTVLADNVTGYDSIETISGKQWYYWDSDSDSAAIILYGGTTYYTVGVNIISLESQYTAARMALINNLHANGYDILTNVGNYIYYPGGSAWLTAAATWLDNSDYTNICLFGWSAGGVAVGYEIQKEGAGDLYNAAVIVAAPVNWTGYGPLFQTAQTADDAEVRTAFICHENDMYNMYSQMQVYYNNMVVDKEWHNWGDSQSPADYHDVFPDTCLTHSGETISEAVYEWFSRPLEVLCFNQYQQQGYVPLYIDGEYVGTTTNTYYVSEGSHIIEVPSYVYDGYYHYFYGWWYNGNPYYTTEITVTVTSDGASATAYYISYY